MAQEVAIPERVQASDLGIGRLFPSIRDAVIVADAISGTIVLWNPAASEVFGYSESEAVGMPLENLVPERLRGKHLEGLAGYVRRGPGALMSSGVVEVPGLCMDGTERDLELSLSPLGDVSVPGDFVFAIIRDVSERKRLEAALRHRERRATRLLDFLPSGVFVTDANGRPIYGNPASTELLGLPVDSTIGPESLSAAYSIYRAGTDELYPTDLLPVVRALAGESTVTADIEIQHPGRRIPLEVWGAPIFDENGTLEYAIAAFVDVTQRKALEEELLQTQKLQGIKILAEGAGDQFNPSVPLLLPDEIVKLYNRLIADVKQYGIFLLDPAGMVITWQAGAESIKGYQADEILGQPYSVFYPPDEVAAGLPERHLIETARDGRADYEGWRVRKDGSQFWASVVSTAILGDDGELRGFGKVVRDLTDRRAAEQENKLQGFEVLAGGAAHNFNGQLQLIIGYITFVLESMPESDERHKDLRGALEAADKAAGIVASMLTFAREPLLRSRRKPLLSFLDDVAPALSGMLPSSIDWSVDVSPELPPYEIDPDQFEQVLMSLVANSVEAMPEGGKLSLRAYPSSSARLEVALPPGEYVCLCVEDSGTGISPDIRDRMFEPFFTTKGLASANGLGLATVYSMVKGTDGFIDVDSIPDGGTTITLYLPVAK